MGLGSVVLHSGYRTRTSTKIPRATGKVIVVYQAILANSPQEF